MKTKIITSLLILINLALLSGCNTVKGFGEDLSQGGKELSHAADQSK